MEKFWGYYRPHMPTPIVVVKHRLHEFCMCDRDTIQFVMFTVWMFTFVGASRGHLRDITAFLLI